MRVSVKAALALVTALGISACGDATTNSTTTDTSAPSSTTTVEPSTSTTAPITTTTGPTSTTSEPGGPVLIEMMVEAGEVTGGGRIEVELGADVRLTVSADVSDVVHLHGYDLSAAVSPTESAVIEFNAHIPGIFEIELEESGLVLGELAVAP